MPQNKEVHKEYMRQRRLKGSQDIEGSQEEGSQGSQIMPIEGSHRFMFNDDSSILDMDLLYDRRDKLNKIIEYLSSNDKTRRYLSQIRYGTGGPTLDRVAIALSYLGGD